MAKQLGRLMLIKLKEDAAFVTLAALKSKSISINNNAVDVTTPDYDAPEGPLWTEVLTGATNLAVSGSGYAKKQAAEATLVGIALSGDAAAEFEIVVPNIGTFSGFFHVATTDLGGEQEDGVTFGLSLNSTGAITFVAEAA